MAKLSYAFSYIFKKQLKTCVFYSVKQQCTLIIGHLQRKLNNVLRELHFMPSCKDGYQLAGNGYGNGYGYVTGMLNGCDYKLKFKLVYTNKQTNKNSIKVKENH